MKRKRETKYVFQSEDYHPYQCGPIAIYNSLRKKNKYISLRALTKMCMATEKHGTSIANMNKTIKQINEITESDIQVTKPIFENIIDVLNSDKQIIILYHWSNQSFHGEHYALIDSIEDNMLKIINYSFDEPIQYISMDELREMLLHYKRENGDVIPKTWIMK